MLSLFIAIPLAAAFAISLVGRSRARAGEMIAAASCAALALGSLAVAPRAVSGALVSRLGELAVPAGVPLVVDALAALMLIVASGISLCVVLYSIGYMRGYTDLWKYYTLVMVMVAGVNGVVMAGDIFTLFVYLEVASIAAYALIAFGTEAEAFEGAFKYAAMSAVASSFILLGIALLYAYTGTLNLADMARTIGASAHPASVVRLVSVFVLMGLGVKAALAPFHAWMPDAYASAPATVPAMSSGVLVKTLGVYALARLFFNVFGMNAAVSGILITFAVLSMVAGGVMAFGQTNIKRLLGCSSVSQIGYIFLGLGIGTPLAVAAALFHLFNHSVAKALLFLNAGEFETDSGTAQLSGMSPVGRTRPLAAVSSLCAALSICGLPPFAGFWSKLLLIIACLEAGRPGLALLAVIVSMLTVAYYFKALGPVVTGDLARPETAPVPRHIAGTAALVLLTVLAVCGGVLLMPGAPRALITHAASVLTNGAGYASIIMGVAK